jgi:hypothetical protein
MRSMGREIRAHSIPGVGSSECFRKNMMFDQNTSALEWLDTTLADLKYLSNMSTYSFIMSVLRAALGSCVVLECHGYVNTGKYLLPNSQYLLITLPQTTSPPIFYFLVSGKTMSPLRWEI